VSDDGGLIRKPVSNPAGWLIGYLRLGTSPRSPRHETVLSRSAVSNQPRNLLKSSFISWLARCCLAVAALISGLTASAMPLQEARVVKVIDGDSFIAMNAANERLSVRIAGIDAPELQQPYGLRARDHLRQMLGQGDPVLRCFKRDHFGRHVCEVRVGESDLGLEQVRAGLAWWYRQYRKEQMPDSRARYAAAESEAQAEQRGLWLEPAIEPGQWRKRQRQPRQTH